MDQSEHEQLLDVWLIGAGWSGPFACGHCLAEGLKTLALKARSLAAYMVIQRIAAVQA
jgi:hypothetical protein